MSKQIIKVTAKVYVETVFQTEAEDIIEAKRIMYDKMEAGLLEWHIVEHPTSYDVTNIKSIEGTYYDEYGNMRKIDKGEGKLYKIFETIEDLPLLPIGNAGFCKEDQNIYVGLGKGMIMRFKEIGELSETFKHPKYIDIPKIDIPKALTAVETNQKGVIDIDCNKYVYAYNVSSKRFESFIEEVGYTKEECAYLDTHSGKGMIYEYCRDGNKRYAYSTFFHLWDDTLVEETLVTTKQLQKEDVLKALNKLRTATNSRAGRKIPVMQTSIDDMY